MAPVALLTPFAAPSVRGNAVTVERIASGLRERGVDVQVWDLSRMDAEVAATAIEDSRPAVVHAFHAWHTGLLAARLARRLEVPLVVTLTGTDANHDLFDPERAAAVRRVLEAAACVTAFDASMVARVTAVLPDVAARVAVVAQAVRFTASQPFDLEATWRLPADRVLFLLPAGIRPVKAPRRPLRVFDALVARRPGVRLAYVGPVLDEVEGEALARALRDRPWARHLGAVAHARMPALLAAADVVLNCSVSEGGMANSVLEAMAAGRAVLASDIPGNRALVEHDVRGLLFDSDDAMLDAAGRLAGDAGLRARLGVAARAFVDQRFPPSHEIDGYLAVYRRLLPVAAR